MEPIRRAIESIRKYLGGLKSGQWLVLSLLGVILVMSLVMVVILAGTREMQELMPTATAEDQQRAIPILQAHGIRHETRGGKLYVSESQQLQALAAVYQSGQQPNNSVLVFDNLIKNQSWLNSKEQNRQAFQATLNNYLSNIISRFEGVKSANVFVDSPESVGIGQAARPAKASITLFGKTNSPLPQATIDAAARTVAGSVAGLDISRVSVTEGAGRPRKITDESELSTTTYRENAAALERQFREKIYNLVRHIDGVVVEVTATVDVTKSRIQTMKNLPVGQGTVAVPKKESSTTSSQLDGQSSAEPGIRSNAQANINTGGSAGSKNEQNQDDTEFAVGIGTENKQIDDPGGMPTRLVATVNVPRGFIIAAWQATQPKPEGNDKPVLPTPENIQAEFAREETSIRKALEPHVKTRAPNGQIVDGEVVVTLVSGETLASGGNGSTGSMAGVGGSLGSIMGMGGGVVEKAVLGGLAILSVGMMLLMVRRAGKRLVVPTAEELVGVPPQLQAKDDLVGEADESETAIAGIELGEAEIRADKIREQVAELVKDSPEIAAKMLNRWISVEE